MPTGQRAVRFSGDRASFASAVCCATDPAAKPWLAHLHYFPLGVTPHALPHAIAWMLAVRSLSCIVCPDAATGADAAWRCRQACRRWTDSPGPGDCQQAALTHGSRPPLDRATALAARN